MPSAKKTPSRRGRARKSKGDTIERVLALDTSSTCVGWALFENGELTRHGKYVQKGKGHGEKLALFRRWLHAVIVSLQPHQVIYEKPFAGRRRFTFGVLTMYVSVVLAEAFEHFACELPEANAVAARDVKKLNKMRKGKDHEQNKKLAVLLANRLYSLRLKYKSNDKTKKVSQDDEADAILLGRAWMLRERPELFGSPEEA